MLYKLQNREIEISEIAIAEQSKSVNVISNVNFKGIRNTPDNINKKIASPIETWNCKNSQVVNTKPILPMEALIIEFVLDFIIFL